MELIDAPEDGRLLLWEGLSKGYVWLYDDYYGAFTQA